MKYSIYFIALITILTFSSACKEKMSDANSAETASLNKVAEDMLPSWNEGSAKQAIIDDVAAVTQEGEQFAPISERIAVFDYDGNLWSEKPLYFQLYLHHTDSIREWAYDRTTSVSRLDKGLDEGQAKGWTIIDMENDWKVVYPFEKSN